MESGRNRLPVHQIHDTGCHRDRVASLGRLAVLADLLLDRRVDRSHFRRAEHGASRQLGLDHLGVRHAGRTVGVLVARAGRVGHRVGARRAVVRRRDDRVRTGVLQRAVGRAGRRVHTGVTRLLDGVQGERRRHAGAVALLPRDRPDGRLCAGVAGTELEPRTELHVRVGVLEPRHGLGVALRSRAGRDLGTPDQRGVGDGVGVEGVVTGLRAVVIHLERPRCVAARPLREPLELQGRLGHRTGRTAQRVGRVRHPAHRRRERAVEDVLTVSRRVGLEQQTVDGERRHPILGLPAERRVVARRHGLGVEGRAGQGHARSVDLVLEVGDPGPGGVGRLRGRGPVRVGVGGGLATSGEVVVHRGGRAVVVADGTVAIGTGELGVACRQRVGRPVGSGEAVGLATSGEVVDRLVGRARNVDDPAGLDVHGVSGGAGVGCRPRGERSVGRVTGALDLLGGVPVDDRAVTRVAVGVQVEPVFRVLLAAADVLVRNTSRTPDRVDDGVRDRVPVAGGRLNPVTADRLAVHHGSPAIDEVVAGHELVLDLAERLGAGLEAPFLVLLLVRALDELRVPVLVVEGLGVARDLLRVLVLQIDHALPGRRRGRCLRGLRRQDDRPEAERDEEGCDERDAPRGPPFLEHSHSFPLFEAKKLRRGPQLR